MNIILYLLASLYDSTGTVFNGLKKNFFCFLGKNLLQSVASPDKPELDMIFLDIYKQLLD